MLAKTPAATSTRPTMIMNKAFVLLDNEDLPNSLQLCRYLDKDIVQLPRLIEQKSVVSVDTSTSDKKNPSITGVLSCNSLPFITLSAYI